MTATVRELLKKIEDAARWDMPCEATSNLIATWAAEATTCLDNATHEKRFISPWLTRVAVIPDWTLDAGAVSRGES